MLTGSIIRLAGYGGAGLFLRTVVIPAEAGSTGAEPLTIAFDITLHSPQVESTYYARTVEPGFLKSLADFCLAAAADDAPEASSAQFYDGRCGLELSIVSSTPSRIGLLVRAVRDLEELPIDWDAMDFETSRAALAQLSIDTRMLLGEDAWNVSTEPPQEWN